MKSVFHKIFSLVMALFFLASTSGVILASHSCLTDSSKSISLFENAGCCAEKEAPCSAPVTGGNTVSSRCCVTDYSFHKIDASSTVVVAEGKLFSAQSSVAVAPFLVPAMPASVPAFSSVHDPPHHYSGKKLLLSIHRLLV